MKLGIHLIMPMQIFLLMSLMVVISPAQSAEKKAKERLAVIDLVPKWGVEKGFAEALSVIVRDKLHSFGDYQVMSAEDIQQVASREQLMQAMGCDDSTGQCLVDFGRKIDSRFMVAGDLSKIGSTYTVSLRMLDTKGDGAGVINRVSESCKCNDDALIGTVQNVAARLVNKQDNSIKKKAEDEAKKLAEVMRKEEEESQNLTAGKEIMQKEKPVIEIEQKPISKANIKQESVTRGATLLNGKAFIDPTTSMEFVFVEGGCFQMGDSYGDGHEDEKPVHNICIDSFYIGKYEVTQKQYVKITDKNPSIFTNGDNYPVENVSWNDAQDFLNALNAKSGKKYRLPTESEWEYAAKSGGKNEKYAGGGDYHSVAWYDGNSDKTPHPVGQKRPNGLGIYDMSGNIKEWCSDWYEIGYYAKSPRKNPLGPSFGMGYVRRGGSWDSSPEEVRAANRGRGWPSYEDVTANNNGGWQNYKEANLGFRIVHSVQRQ